MTCLFRLMWVFRRVCVCVFLLSFISVESFVYGKNDVCAYDDGMKVSSANNGKKYDSIRINAWTGFTGPISAFKLMIYVSFAKYLAIDE